MIQIVNSDDTKGGKKKVTAKSFKGKTKKIKYNNKRQGFRGTPNKVESYAAGIMSKHKV